MLIEVSVAEALVAVVAAGADRRDDRQGLVAGGARDRFGGVEESGAEATMLGAARRFGADRDAAAVDMQLAHERVRAELFDEGIFRR